MNKSLVGSSIVVLIFTFLFALQENVTSQWRVVQRGYRALSIRKAETPEQKKQSGMFRVRLRQVDLPHLGVTDRCVTCHVDMEDPRFGNARHPFRTHPGNYLKNHDPMKFGCTLCHDGQGRATINTDAVARSEHVRWERPVLRQPFIQSNCYRCHTDPLEQTPVYNKGKRLFETNGCLCCHKLEGRGGYLAPELGGIGEASTHIKYPTHKMDGLLGNVFTGNKNLAYIYESVRYPKAQPEDSLMYDYGFSHDEALAITVYLKGFKKKVRDPATLPPGKRKTPPTRLENGRRLFAQFCSACHGKEGAGGIENPNSAKGEVPTLDEIADTLGLWKENEAMLVIDAIEKKGNFAEIQPPPELSDYPMVRAQYLSVRGTILNGNLSGKVDPKGPEPLNMPSWAKTIEEGGVDSLIAYLISLYEFEE